MRRRKEELGFLLTQDVPKDFHQASAAIRMNVWFDALRGGGAPLQSPFLLTHTMRTLGAHAGGILCEGHAAHRDAR